MENTVFEITLKKDKRIIPELASFIAESAKKMGLSQKKARFLCFTMETVLEYRSDAMDENSEISIKVDDTGSYFRFSVTDFGSPYILTKNQQAILKRKLVDRYSFEQRGRKGQCFSFMYKYDALVPKVEFKSDRQELLDEDFVFRRLKKNDEDILSAIRCLYDTYGYDYYHQHLYSAENFRKCMNSGTYVPIIGVNGHNQTMCYSALDENLWFEGVPEFSNLVTNPIARGKGLATKIFKEAEKIAEDMEYEGIHVSAVAYHPYTQKMCNKLGYTPSAIEYEINPPGTGGYDSTRRLECVIGVKIFNKEKKHELYLRPECNDMFNMIYKAENLNYEIHNEDPDGDFENVLTYVVDTDTSNCFVKIDECAKDIEESLNRMIQSEEVKSADVVTVNLNMNTPGSVYGYDALRKMGFICTGCIPGSVNGDYMLLQSFKVAPVYEKIVVEPNYYELVKELYKLNRIDL